MKRIISIIVTIVIMCSLLIGSVCAEPDLTLKFKDVKDADWFAEAVGRLNALEIIDGLPGGIFGPKSEVTRAQFVKMLVQAMGYQKIDSISFDDIKPLSTRKAHWASVYIETALRNGVIVKAETGNNFYPETPITRKDMAMMMYRALELQPSKGENPFADITEANEAFTRLFEEYLVRGTLEGGKRIFKPEGLSTRAEAAVVIARMLEYKANPAEFKQKEDLNEKLRNGTYTEEDLALKAKLELAKQAEDKEYIPEPVIKYEYNPTKGIFVKGNLINVADFGSDHAFKIVCTNYPDLNKLAHNNIYGNYVEVDMTRPFTVKEAEASFLSVPKWDAMKVGTKGEYYQFDFKPGTKLAYSLYITRGTTTKKQDIVVTIQ